MDNKSLIKSIEKHNTPTITNVVATYPGDNELCLGLYNPWESNWYTDETVKCVFPELGPRAGYAVTCVYGMPDPSFTRLSLVNVLKAIEESPKPVILVIKQDLPERIRKKNGLAGGKMTTAFKTLGCVGVISDGPSRDLDEIREMDFQYMLTGTSAGHGEFAVYAVNVPVTIGSMDVTPGEIIHMDEHGAVKFPADKLSQVADLSEKLAVEENHVETAIAKCKTAEQIARVMAHLDPGDY